MYFDYLLFPKPLFRIGLTLHGDGESNSDINIRAAFVHVLGDLMQSIGPRVYKLYNLNEFFV